jgi:hypothetical protein
MRPTSGMYHSRPTDLVIRRMPSVWRMPSNYPRNRFGLSRPRAKSANRRPPFLRGDRIARATLDGSYLGPRTSRKNNPETKVADRDPEFPPSAPWFLLQAKVFVDSRTHKEFTFDFAVTFGFFLDTYYDKRNSRTQGGNYPVGPGAVGQAKEL